MKVALPVIALVLFAYTLAFYASCRRVISERMNPPLSRQPPKELIGAFRYDRPYSSKEIIMLAGDVCQAEAERRGIPYADFDGDLRPSKMDLRYWLYCQVYSTKDPERPAFDLWLKQEEKDGAFIWIVHEADLDSRLSPAPQGQSGTALPPR